MVVLGWRELVPSVVLRRLRFFFLLTGAIAEAIRQNLLLGGKAYRKTTQSTESTSALRLLFGCARPVEPLLAILIFIQPIPAISEAPG